MIKRIIAVVSILGMLSGVGWAGGTWSTNNFGYKPQLTTQGTTDKANTDTSQDRIDARLGKEVWVGDTNTAGLTTLAAAVATYNASGDKVTLHLAAGTYSIITNLTVNTNILLKPENGVTLAINNATLTINGGFEAGLHQFFSCTGTGKVVFGSGSVRELYGEWWGASADGVINSTTALTAALTAAKATKVPVSLGAGTYLVDSLTVDTAQMRGTGITATTLKTRSVVTNFITVTGGVSGITVQPELSNLNIDCDNKATYGVVLNSAQQARVADLIVQKAISDGVYLEASVALGGNYYNILENIRAGANIVGNGRNGFRIVTTDGPTVSSNMNNSNTFINCTAHSNTAAGWYIDYSAGNTFLGCNAEGNHGPGISTIYALNLGWFGGYTEHNADYGADAATTYRKLTVGSVTGDYSQGESVSQAVSGATGIVIGWQSNLGILWLEQTSGTFNTANVVTGGCSGATSTPSAVGYADISFFAERTATILTMTGVALAYTAGEAVTQAVTGATGTVLAWNPNTSLLYLSGVTVSFDTTNVVTGGGSGATGTPSVWRPSNGVAGITITGGRHIGKAIGDWYRAGNRLLSWSDPTASPINDDQGNAYLYKLNAVSYKTPTSNGAAGTLTLTAGTSTTVNNTSVTANSLIFPVPTNAGAAAIVPYQSAVSAGVSFTLTHAAAAGTETYNYFIIN